MELGRTQWNSIELSGSGTSVGLNEIQWNSVELHGTHVKDLEKGHADYTAKVMKVTQSKAFKYLKVCERTGREPGADL